MATLDHYDEEIELLAFCIMTDPVYMPSMVSREKIVEISKILRMYMIMYLEAKYDTGSC